MKDSICFITSYGGLNIEPQNMINGKDGCYGSEYALYETAKRLVNDYNVFITVIKPTDYFLRTDGINWIAEGDYDKWVQYAKPKHIIVLRYISPFMRYFFPKDAKIYLWLHDILPLLHDEKFPIQKQFMSLCNRFVDKYISVGNQVIKNHYVPTWGMDESKFITIKNGITLENNWNVLSTKRKPLSFVFSSSVGKGLWVLLDYWKELIKKFPQATLDLYYGYPLQDVERLNEYLESYPSVKYHGKVSQKELFEVYKVTDYWFFPCKDEETCSTTCFETAYYGPIQITNTKGALIENVSGFKFDDNSSFWENVLRTLESLESNPITKDSIRKIQYQFALENTWDHRASMWKELFRA